MTSPARLFERLVFVALLASAGCSCGADPHGVADAGPGVDASNGTDAAEPPPVGYPPAFSSGHADYDAAYLKALAVIDSDIVAGKFIAGENWARVWTRDSAYSIDLGAGLVQPEVSKATLEAMIDTWSEPDDTWAQDIAGHFGGWPRLTDSIVGAQGAWALYAITGDRDMLARAYDVTVSTLARAERDAFDASSGLFKGCSTFMESNSGYPARFQNDGELVGRTKALSTNILYYRAYVVAAEMARILGADPAAFDTKAAALATAINARLWSAELGYYVYFEDETGAQETRMEATGNAFAVVWGVADAERAASIMANIPVTPSGIPCLWPQYPDWTNYDANDASYYHNGMVWPFVQGYWAWAAARAKSTSRLEVELDRLRALSERADTFHEFYRPEDGTPDGSPRQLWSAAGYLAMIYHALFGMELGPTAIDFAPVVPPLFDHLTLEGVHVRDMTLNVTVNGAGTEIASFMLDGAAQAEHRVASDLTGTHDVVIEMAPLL